MEIRTQDTTMVIITSIVCKEYNLEAVNVKGTTKEADIAEARQVIMWITKHLTPYSLKKIGDHFNGRNGKRKDHATVLYSIKQINNLIETNKNKKAFIESLLNKCYVTVKGEPMVKKDILIMINPEKQKFITLTGFGEKEANDIREIIVNNFTK